MYDLHQVLQLKLNNPEVVVYSFKCVRIIVGAMHALASFLAYIVAVFNHCFRIIIFRKFYKMSRNSF